MTLKKSTNIIEDIESVKTNVTIITQYLMQTHPISLLFRQIIQEKRSILPHLTRYLEWKSI